MSKKEKAVQLSQSAWSKTKTAVARTKQKAMVAMGKADQTVDISFNQQKEIFNEHYEAIKKLNKDATKVLDILKDLSLATSALADDFTLVFDGDGDGANNSEKAQEIAKAIDIARQEFDDTIRRDFLDPVSKYIGQYKDVKNRIEILETRRVDMDRYSRDLRTHQEKAKTDKAAVTQQKFETAKANYGALSDELMKDMPLLLEDRIPFFEPVLATYIVGVNEFYRGSSAQWSGGLSMVQHVDRSRIADYPRITTPPESSAATHKISASYSPTTSSFSNYEPPQSEPSAPPSQPSSAPKSLPPKPQPAASTGAKAQALYDFNPQDTSELGFKVGDIVMITKQNGDWWEGELKGKRGLLPSNYVKLI